MSAAGLCAYTGCNDPIETGLRLPWRHTNGLRRNIRPHYAMPVPASRSAVDGPTRGVVQGTTAAARRDDQLPSEAPDTEAVIRA